MFEMPHAGEKTKRGGAPRCRCPVRTGMYIAFAATLLVLDAADAGDRIYVSQDQVDRMPVYTDRPVNGSSRMLMSFADPLAEKRKVMGPFIERAARTHGVDPALLYAVVEVESRFDSRAVSPKGAMGLAQVMPATAKRYGKFNLFSPEQNLDVGTRYLRDLLTMFKGDIRLAVAAYNAGEGAVMRFGNRVPPYPETQQYVTKVLGRHAMYRSRGWADRHVPVETILATCAESPISDLC